MSTVHTTAPARTPSALRLSALHARYQFLETIRVPIAVVGTTVFPALSFLFFVCLLYTSPSPRDS